MNSKLQGLEKELERERRKLRDMQESARERDKEYHKLKVSHPNFAICAPFSGFYLTLLVRLFLEPLRQNQTQGASRAYCTRERTCLRRSDGTASTERQRRSSDGPCSQDARR